MKNFFIWAYAGMLLVYTGWRIEVKGGGKYYGFRKGSGKERISRYGGKFSGLDEGRKTEYQKNKKSKSRVKQKTTA